MTENSFRRRGARPMGLPPPLPRATDTQMLAIGSVGVSQTESAALSTDATFGQAFEASLVDNMDKAAVGRYKGLSRSIDG